MSRCLLTIREQRSSTLGEPRGWRVLTTTPNMAARTMSGEPCPSFEKPFAIEWFGDFVDQDDILRNMPSVVKTLRRMGYTKIDLV